MSDHVSAIPGYPPRRSGRTTARWHRSLYWFLVPALLFIAVFTFYPVIYNFVLSTQKAELATINSGSPRVFIGLDNYLKVIENSDFPGILLNSVVFTVASVGFQFVIGFFLALLFTRNFPTSRFVRGTIVVGWVLPDIVVGTIWSWILNGDVGVLNFIMRSLGIIHNPIGWLSDPHMAMYGVIIANIWFGIPFNMMLLLGGLSGVPDQLYEVASIDGANAFQKFFHLTVPMMRKSIAATIMLGVIYTFRVFGLIWVMTGGGPVNATNVLTTYSYQLSFNFYNFGQGSAVANMLFLIMFAFSILYIRNY